MALIQPVNQDRGQRYFLAEQRLPSGKLLLSEGETAGDAYEGLFELMTGPVEATIEIWRIDEYV